jgi:hypothetical protein
MHGGAGDQVPEPRIDLPCPTVEDARPLERGEAVGQALGLGGVVAWWERVVLVHEAEFLRHQLLGQPFVASDVDLDGARQPGLQAAVDQAALGIEEVVLGKGLCPLKSPESADLATIGGVTHFLSGGLP